MHTDTFYQVSSQLTFRLKRRSKYIFKISDRNNISYFLFKGRPDTSHQVLSFRVSWHRSVGEDVIKTKILPPHDARRTTDIDRSQQLTMSTEPLEIRFIYALKQ